MKIGRYQFKGHKVQFGDRLRGYIEVPVGARALFYGVEPALKGNLCMWVEESSIALAPTMKQLTETREFMILKPGDEVPPGYKYVGSILANPVLVVYELLPDKPLLN